MFSPPVCYSLLDAHACTFTPFFSFPPPPPSLFPFFFTHPLTDLEQALCQHIQCMWFCRLVVYLIYIDQLINAVSFTVFIFRDCLFSGCIESHMTMVENSVSFFL